MDSNDVSIEERFYNELSKKMENGNELEVKQIYLLFPNINKKTISWRLYDLVQRGKLYKTGHGYYALTEVTEHNAMGYNYMQKQSQAIYDTLIDYGYTFYISGLDALTGEMLHMPEKYPALIVAEESGINEIQGILKDKFLMALTEKERNIIGKTINNDQVDAIIFTGKDFSLSKEHIARKEKGFVDLYYAVTRMDYGVSIPELSRIYQSLRRNKTVAMEKMKISAKDRGIVREINWLIELNRLPEKVLEFMRYQLKEEPWRG